MSRRQRPRHKGAGFIGVPTVVYQEPAVAGRTPWAARARTVSLFSDQLCYACGSTIPRGSDAHWSKRLQGWRHPGCSVPVPRVS